MKKNFTILMTILFIVACDNVSKEQNVETNEETQKIKEDSIDIVQIDSFLIEETVSQIDRPANDYMTARLKPIRENFKRINSVSRENWSSIKTQYLEGTNEGGEVTYYHRNKSLDKIVTKEFGETFQVLTEYYLLRGQLSFVYQKVLKYNRSIWKHKPDSSDKEIFNIDKSEIEETRNYFENGKLINQISNQDCGSPFSDDYLIEEQKEFIKNYNRVLKEESKK